MNFSLIWIKQWENCRQPEKNRLFYPDVLVSIPTSFPTTMAASKNLNPKNLISIIAVFCFCIFP